MKASIYLKALQKITKEDLLNQEGFAEKSANSVINFITSDKIKNLIRDFEYVESLDKGPEIIISETKIIGEKGIVCITGTFNIPRTEIVSYLEKMGYETSNTVNKITTHLVCGEKAGSKLAKAKKLDIPIVFDYKELI